MGQNGLQNYKPSSRLVEEQDIDNQLGMKKLVQTPTTANGLSEGRQLLAPAAKARQQLDQWSTNNGSIILAQPDGVKNHYAPNSDNGIGRGEGVANSISRATNNLNQSYMTLGRNRNKLKAMHLQQSIKDHTSTQRVALGQQYSSTRLSNGDSHQGANSVDEPTCHMDTLPDHEQDQEHNDQIKWSDKGVTMSDLLF